MGEQIIIVVSPDGTTKVETKGFQGSTCKDATKALEQALGTVESETLKPEYHQGGSVARKIETRS